ncbi:MAG: hypothetical protein LUD78_00370, partial [Clostridiales bacterium]|nr:hypothetical protein [Clostridiales bacterium]
PTLPAPMNPIFMLSPLSDVKKAALSPVPEKTGIPADQKDVRLRGLSWLPFRFAPNTVHQPIE